MELISGGLVESAHDCADGGIAVALAEKAFPAGVGARVNLQSRRASARNLRCSARMRAGSWSLATRRSVARIKEVAEKYGIAADVIGETMAEQLEISLDGKAVISATVAELSRAYEGALETALRTDPELVAAD